MKLMAVKTVRNGLRLTFGRGGKRRHVTLPRAFLLFLRPAIWRQVQRLREQAQGRPKGRRGTR